MPYVGEIRIVPFNFAPTGWSLCQGQLKSISENETLFNLIGTTYGGNGTDTFGLPDLRGRVPLHPGNGFVQGENGGVEEIALLLAQIAAHNHALRANPIDGHGFDPTNAVPAGSKGGLARYAESPNTVMLATALGNTGGSQPHDNMMPFLALNFIISEYGSFPDPNSGGLPEGQEPILGELRLVSFNFAPKGWALCNGQLLPINQNQALFSILGTSYGGNGTVTFGLPDLRGRAPLGFDNTHSIGERGGALEHALTVPQLPAHTHAFHASNGNATQASPANGTLAKIPSSSTEQYAGTADVDMDAASIDPVGNGNPHTNVQPYLTLNVIIALQGVFPSRQ